MIEIIEVEDEGITLENIGTKVKRIRQQKEWLRPVLAEKAGISSQAIKDLEVGHHYPRLDTLLMILDALGQELIIRGK